MLRREYSFRDALKDDWAVVPVDMLAQDDGVLLVLADDGGSPLQQSARPFALAPFLSLARSMSETVADMHASGVVHLALTPGRILIADDGSVRLTGFGFATRIGPDGAVQPDADLEWDSVTFNYMAPELGARMGTGVDARTDLYALGCMFYEMLVGTPPFEGADASGLVHAHATHSPVPPHRRQPKIPEQLSNVVLKLLEKAPERRYANASQLLLDLRQCEELHLRHGSIPAFATNVDAALQRLLHDDRITGREAELAVLMDVYREVAAGGRMRAMWISGRSGIGKSSLIRAAVSRMQSLGTPLLARAKGDDARRGTPYDILTQALEPLLQYVVGCPESEFVGWRHRLAAATAPARRMLVALLPSLGVVLGQQPESEKSAPATPAAEREHALQGMANLVNCFATPGRPLVLVLDDLQWADPDTMEVLQRLVGDTVETPLLLIGALRSDEIDVRDDAFGRLLAKASRSTRLELGPLDEQGIRELMSHALGLDASDLGSVAELILHKTGGNPFFARHLLRRLADERLLEYDASSAAWHWSLEKIHAHADVGDIVDLVMRRIEQLPAQTLAVVQLLSCFGNRATNAAIALTAARPEHAVEIDFQPALESGCVYREGNEWVFCHDRIRESAYGSIAMDNRALRHLGIVRRLLEDGGRSADVFTAATQANLARAAIGDLEERLIYGRLNLEAGRRAKSATAHHSAMGFFRAALEFFGAEAGEDALAARMLCGEAEYMTGALDVAEARLATLDGVVGSDVFNAELARVRSALYTTIGAFDRALDVGLAFLREAGIDIPRRPGNADVDLEYACLRTWLDGHGVRGLRDLPIATEPLQRAMDIFADLLPPALYTDQNLMDFMLLRMANVAIKHGHADASANGYVCMVQIFGVRYGDYATARQFGELALHLVDDKGLRKHQARVYHTYGTLVVPWTAPARTARDYIGRAFEIATDQGDHTFALYCGRNQATGMLFAGEFLEDVRRTVQRGLRSAREAKFQLVVDALLAQGTLLARLQDGETNEETMAEPVDGAPVTLVDLAYWVYRLQVGVLLGDQAEALTSRRRAEACEMVARTFAERGDLALYGALALIAVPVRDLEQSRALERHLADLDLWAVACPSNFEARRDLARAELARTDGRVFEAEEGYARAVAHARRHEFTQIEAIASELASTFYAGRGRDVESRAYLRHAVAAWQRWGAAAKVRQLQILHPALLGDEERTAATTSRLHELDLQAVLRISNALASDIVPARLIETVMRTALESAGAEYGALALLRDGVWSTRAQARLTNEVIVVSQCTDDFSAEVLPVSLVRAVARTQEGRVVEDGRESPAFAEDDYVRRVRPRSMLCVPLIRFSKLVGVLYLENNLAAKVFTTAKAEVMEVISSQAAFALENARLYEELIDQGRQKTQAEERLRTALAELARASRLKAMGELVASIVHEIGQPISALDTSASAAVRWLDRPVPDIPEASAMLARISLSAKRAKSIIQGLRAMARKAEPQFSTLDLADALREVVAMVEGALEEQGVTLTLHGLDTPCLVRGDRVQLQQVAINLLLNGGEAMAAVPQALRQLSLSCAPGDERSVLVTVDDAGCGIAPEVAERLLEPFFTTKADGMGMGLAICKSIVDAHDGTMTLSQRETAGTRVSVVLPRISD